MNFLEKLKRDNDAKLVKELYEKWRHTRSADNQNDYARSADWFFEKWDCEWASIMKTKDR